jgi:hypothetical protein
MFPLFWTASDSTAEIGQYMLGSEGCVCAGADMLNHI